MKQVSVCTFCILQRQLRINNLVNIRHRNYTWLKDTLAFHLYSDHVIFKKIHPTS